MKLRIYLTVEGQESLATGREIWPWQFNTRLEYKGEFLAADPGAVFLLETDVELPSPASCLPNVVAMLDQRTAEINALAHADLMAISKRKSELLSITYQGE